MILLVILLVAAKLAAELLLAWLNLRELQRNAGAPPAAVASVTDAATYAKSVAYSGARLRYGMLVECFDNLLLLALLFSSLLPALRELFAPLSPTGAWDDALFLLAVLFLLSIPSLPFEWWEHFRLEQSHGFNRLTPSLWLTDKLKGALLGVLLGFPLLWALLSLVSFAGQNWWLWGFCLLFGFQLLMMVLYPKLILPLFNKLSPLPEGELRTRLLALADRSGFRARTIEVVDGSKRSGHSNAYFTGFGRFRRIVLFDTLVQQLTPAELEAVLAHEIGHYRRGHVPRMLVLAALMQFGGFAAVAWLAQAPWFASSFGLPSGELASAFLLFGLLSGPATFWLSPLLNLLSRRHEYEADAFASQALGGPAELISALRKLAGKNLSNLTPHPLYSGFHYSHPTLVERESALLASPAVH